MRTLATELQQVLSQPAIKAAAKEASVANRAKAKALDRLTKLCGPGKLNGLRYACELARSKKTGAKVQNAQTQLLEFVGKMRGKLTTADFVLLGDSFFQLHLSGVPIANLGPSGQSWLQSGSLFDYCTQLHEADGYKSQTKRWC